MWGLGVEQPGLGVTVGGLRDLFEFGFQGLGFRRILLT